MSTSKKAVVLHQGKWARVSMLIIHQASSTNEKTSVTEGNAHEREEWLRGVRVASPSNPAWREVQDVIVRAMQVLGAIQESLACRLTRWHSVWHARIEKQTYPQP